MTAIRQIQHERNSGNLSDHGGLTMDFAGLAAPFPPEAVSWRVGAMTKDKSKARALAYIDSRDVMRRLDEVVGPANWQDRYEFHGPRTVCYLSLRIDGEWITKADGAGDSDVEAEKGAISDALKRAAVKWGIARYLYDLDSPWVKVNQWNQIDDSELPKLRALLSGVKQKSAYQARKDGDYTELMDEMKLQPTPEILRDWAAMRRERIHQLPHGWQAHFRDAYEAQMDALRSQVAA